jgi:hypothetical protein
MRIQEDLHLKDFRRRLVRVFVYIGAKEVVKHNCQRALRAISTRRAPKQTF